MSNCGFVLSDDMQLRGGVIRHYVLNTDANCILPIHQSAFRIGHEEAELDVATRKNLQRRLGRPLLFGDIIEWSDHQVNNHMIISFTKVSKLFKTQHVDGKSQFPVVNKCENQVKYSLHLKVLMEGVLSPEDSSRFWTIYFPNLSVKVTDIILESSISCAMLSNVLVLAWINISVNNDGRMFVEFDSFYKVPIEGQDKVASAPWNANLDKYSMVKVVTDIDTWDDMIVKPSTYRPKKSEWQKELFQRTGLLTGDRTIFCKDFPCYEFIIPLITEVDDQPPLEIGLSLISYSFIKLRDVCAYYKFHAFWNEYEKVYMVNEYRLKKDVVRHPLCPNGLLRITVKACDGYPGVYKNEQYGFLDDPKGVLALYHLSKYANSSVVVSVKDGGAVAECPFRFRIMEVLQDKARKLTKWTEEEKSILYIQIAVKNSKGIIVEDLTVFSKDHSELLFKLVLGVIFFIFNDMVMIPFCYYVHLSQEFFKLIFLFSFNNYK
uniref:Tudor domain-containing protein n=1 Tax=Heterorhabditis bacteriophora TaxID=37862 RepID=A0A1I7WQX3_HETBA